MKKLKLHTPDFTEANIAKLAELFPQCVTETKDENGEPKRAIDFDLLKQELSSSLIEGGQERYQLNWVGKKEALLTANAPIAKTLRPSRAESVDFDSTQNLYIEGDNLDALKLLQENYLNQVKMIYIDPPYNTGNDFIYEDNFAENTADYLARSNQKDEGGNRLISNTESNGRFHSDWLSMMYARLKLARNLLKDNGVIFISIDDNEQANLKRLCDEVFGEDNFIQQIIWKKRGGAPNDKPIGATHEYVLIFSKSIEKIELNYSPRNDEQVSRYKNPDNHPKGNWAPDNLMANVKGGRFVKSLHFPIVNPNTGEEHYPGDSGNWRYNKEKIEALLKNDEIYFGKDDSGRPKLKRFLCDVKDGVSRPTIWDWVGFNNSGSQDIQSMLGNINIFDTPKPSNLIKEMIQLASNPNDIILDFFSGSATTAHAVMQLNAEDGGNRKFIMVQLPEPCDEKSEAFKAGYKTIADIGKERIRQAGQKIKTENADKEGIEQLDIGFRVLKIDSSNMNEVYYSPDQTNQQDLLNLVDNIKADRSDEDLLFQVLLDWGVDLTLPITEKTLDEKTVFTVAENEIVACFDRQGGITEEFIKQITTSQPKRAVFCDAGFTDDSVKINVEQLFKSLAPHTEIKTL